MKPPKDLPKIWRVTTQISLQSSDDHRLKIELEPETLLLAVGSKYSSDEWYGHVEWATTYLRVLNGRHKGAKVDHATFFSNNEDGSEEVRYPFPPPGLVPAEAGVEVAVPNKD